MRASIIHEQGAMSGSPQGTIEPGLHSPRLVAADDQHTHGGESYGVLGKATSRRAKRAGRHSARSLHSLHATLVPVSRAPDERFETRTLSGWGGFPTHASLLARPERRSVIAQLLGAPGVAMCTPRGLGRSYSDAALNDGGCVIDMTRLDRMLDFDPASGVLECEAGTSLSDIVHHFLPRGWFLAVTPGTRFVTVGGAIASDVHGKNHHRDGTVVSSVLSFTLQTGGGDLLRCSREEHSDVFWATLGGMGLTGVVLTARLRLRPVTSAYVSVDYAKAAHIDDALGRFALDDARYEYSVAWIDCLARGVAMGRAVLMRANHTPVNDLPASVRNPLALPRRLALGVPFDLPGIALNRYSVGAFNAVYYHTHRHGSQRIVDLGRYFYPLDAISNWNRMYGRRGFTQYQVAFPQRTARDALVAVLERLTASRRASFLAVLKQFGAANQAPLSFPIPGFTLALDIPVNDGTAEFVGQLNALALQYGGRVYLAKDAVLDAPTLSAMYPRAAEFVALARKLDPEGRISSSLARRVGLDSSATARAAS